MRDLSLPAGRVAAVTVPTFVIDGGASPAWVHNQDNGDIDMNTITDKSARQTKFPKGIIVVSVLTMIFGLAEIVTSFTHTFYGLTTSQTTISTIIGASIGTFYFVSGLLVLTKRKTAAVIAIVLLIIDATGRILMVLTGLYPFDSPQQKFAIFTGTSIVVLFAVYIRLKIKHFK